MSDTRRMNDIDHAIDAYDLELARRKRSRATRTKYQDLLWKLSDFVGDTPCSEITREDCQRFLDQWVEASESTLGLHISCLRGFFAFLIDCTVIEYSPMDGIRRPRRPRPEDVDVVTLASSDVDRMLAAAMSWDEYLCLAILAYCGPRRTALAQLRRRDLDLDRGAIRFREKGGKIIVKPIPDELAVILKAADKAGEWLTHDEYVIKNRRPTRDKERSSKVIYKLVTDVAKRARVRSHVHALRAAFAVRYLEQHPGDLDALQYLLGHTRTDTTRVYLRRQDKYQAMERVRSLTWAGSGLPSSAEVPPTGFEPVLPESAVPEPIRRKLEELRARNAEVRR